MRTRSLGLLFSLCLVVGSAPALAQGASIATLEATSGGVSVVRQGVAQAATPGMLLLEEDVVVTRAGRATVRFISDGTIVRVGPDSRVQVDESAKERDVTVFFGRVWSHVVRAQERLSRFRSRGTIAAIRGTEISLAVAADADETRVAVIEGHVEAENDAGKVELGAGESAVSRPGARPVMDVRVRPQDAVQWALYYPPVLVAPGEDLGDGAWQQGVRAATAAYEKGDLQGAIDAITAVEEQLVQDPRFFTERAALRLATGAVESASRDIAHALELAPGDARALALDTVVAVAALDTPKALASGRKAVEADPKSAVAQLALSYAKQAAFDLDGAREALDRAVELDPKDALAWARLAELRSSQGDLSGSLEAARKAAELRPGLSRTQTVLGFANLLQLHVDDAKVAFDKAIASDADDPLPRLGKGLALIRGGDVDAGGKEIEVAVSLDPGASVIRSYLGKAYYEAKRTPLDLREFDLGKKTDPHDPTPWFYEAIALQTTNRPGEALESLQKAMELNDDRAVYRSRLLLDSDQAARSASLGRLYADLGFQNRALVEGWTSVNADPTSFSAHRFLADSYSALPRHQIARVSELMQSQMLQPLNTAPIQPRLGESNQFLLAAGGPTSLSFNEFNALFNRDGLGLLASGMYGSNVTPAGEIVVSGIQDRFSFSAGYDHFETDGWRNKDGNYASDRVAFQKDQIANAFVQAELSRDTGVQAEYRFRDQSSGDLQQRFFLDPAWALATNRDSQTKHTGRLGVRHDFAAGSVLLGSLMYQDSTFDNRLEPAPGLKIDANLPQTSLGAELQHLWRTRYLNLVAGGGFFRIDGEQAIAITPSDPAAPPTPPLNTKFDHVDLYAYATAKPIDHLLLTAGVSYDRLEDRAPKDEPTQLNRDANEPTTGEVNPKFGAMWTVFGGTTLRLAAFRQMKRTLVTDQTLEPTQVAGFNQFFDDSDLTTAWRYGGGLDQRIGSSLFAGVEYARRDVTVPFFDFDPVTFAPVLVDRKWAEDLGRAYVFVLPHRWVGLRLQYVYEEFGHGKDFTSSGFKTLKTHRVPVGVAFFHPTGFSVGATATWVNQEGDFENPLTAQFQKGKSHFWLFDAALSYRLPQRYGTLSVALANLGDEKFEYYEIDRKNPTIIPTRTVFARFTVAVP